MLQPSYGALSRGSPCHSQALRAGAPCTLQAVLGQETAQGLNHLPKFLGHPGLVIPDCMVCHLCPRCAGHSWETGPPCRVPPRCCLVQGVAAQEWVRTRVRSPAVSPNLAEAPLLHLRKLLPIPWYGHPVPPPPRLPIQVGCAAPSWLHARAACSLRAMNPAPGRADLQLSGTWSCQCVVPTRLEHLPTRTAPHTLSHSSS